MEIDWIHDELLIASFLFMFWDNIKSLKSQGSSPSEVIGVKVEVVLLSLSYIVH